MVLLLAQICGSHFSNESEIDILGSRFWIQKVLWSKNFGSRKILWSTFSNPMVGLIVASGFRQHNILQDYTGWLKFGSQN